MKILITGATGNVGSAVIDTLDYSSAEVYAGVRDEAKAKEELAQPKLNFCRLDFEKGIHPSLNFEAVFLVRPPQLTDPELFERFLATQQRQTRVVFLSVRGAESRSYLPHAKIERLIEHLGFPHLFIRPAYFMENLTTTLWEELEENKRIYLPAGDLRLSWVAVSDIAEIASEALLHGLKDSAVALGGSERYNFKEVVEKINRMCKTDITYESPFLAQYIYYCLKKGKSWSYIFVMLLLHYFPRFGRKRSGKAGDFERIMGKKPTTLEQFIRNHAETFEKLQTR